MGLEKPFIGLKGECQCTSEPLKESPRNRMVYRIFVIFVNGKD
jgi:hypothetical protein